MAVGLRARVCEQLAAIIRLDVLPILLVYNRAQSSPPALAQIVSVWPPEEGRKVPIYMCAANSAAAADQSARVVSLFSFFSFFSFFLFRLRCDAADLCFFSAQPAAQTDVCTVQSDERSFVSLNPRGSTEMSRSQFSGPNIRSLVLYSVGKQRYYPPTGKNHTISAGCHVCAKQYSIYSASWWMTSPRPATD